MRHLTLLGTLALAFFTGATFGDSHTALGVDAPAGTQPATTAPATNLPPRFISAIRSLFKDGAAPMADPRGGEYREVAIRVTGPHNADALIVTTHAWVVPFAAATPQAVCWNGLAYPVQKLGEKADLDADVKSLLDRERAAFQRYTQTPNTLLWYGMDRYASDQKERVVYDAFDLQHAAMLVRLGRNDLAEKVWDLYVAGTQDTERSPITNDPYAFLATAYAENLANRALGAFDRGEDALSDARACVAACDIGRKVLDERKPVAEKDAAPAPDAEPVADPFSRFDVTTILIADIERRAKEPLYDPVLLNPEKYREKSARIAALIRDLELVGNLPAGSTDDLQIMPEVMIKLLAAEGDDIVEPLLETYQHDSRLTRCAHEGQDIRVTFRDPPPLQVENVRPLALRAAEQIAGIHTSDLQPPGNPNDTEADQQAAALESFRTLWNKLKKVPREDRLCAILQDDDMPLTLWVHAADMLSRPTTATEDPEWIKVRDHLRTLGKKEPSLHQLLLNRFLQLRASTDLAQQEAAHSFAEALAAWSGKDALGALRDYHPRPNFELRTFEMRAALGDMQAIDDYADWLKSRSPRDGQGFRILWEFADLPASKAIAASAFQERGSPWNRFFVANLPVSHSDSPLLVFPEFRRRIIAMLDDKSKSGTALACDVAAASLNTVPGAPPFDRRWDQVRRDAAIAALKDFLIRYGKHIAIKSRARSPGEAVDLRFTPLVAPATPEQLADGDAIFSLAGQGNAQTVKMPLPRRARWFTNTDLIRRFGYFDERAGKNLVIPVDDREGAIWQAEDLTASNKTQRYFGFVRRGVMQRVPADQIDLLPDWRPGPQWTELPGGIDLKLIPAGKSAFDTVPLQYHLGAADAAALTLRLRNRRAVAQPIDARFAEQDAATGALRLRAGFTLHVTKLRPGAAVDYINDPAKTTPLPPRLPIISLPAASPDAAKSLRQPEEEFDAGRIDLRRIFDLSQLGTYGIWLSFDENASPSAPIATAPVALIIDADVSP